MEGRPSLLISMEVLTMSVGELSTALKRLAAETSELTFEPHPPGTLQSDDFDVAITADPAIIRVADPICGKPILRFPADNFSDRLRGCRSFIDALEPRRALLVKLTNALFTELPDFPSPDTHVNIFRLAELCDVHVTTVSRTIQGKVCNTPTGHVPFTQFVTNLRK